MALTRWVYAVSVYAASPSLSSAMDCYFETGAFVHCLLLSLSFCVPIVFSFPCCMSSAALLWLLYDCVVPFLHFIFVSVHLPSVVRLSPIT